MNKPGLDLKIAPKLDHTNQFAFTGEDWCVSDYPTHGTHGQNWTEDDWQKAIDIFEDRLRGRYFNYIDALIDFEYSVRDYHAGFAITALDCLVVETLQQFYDGRDASDGVGKSFERFLTSTSFGDEKLFGKDTSNGSLADLFYDQIRCGILHQAEIKSDSRIVSESDADLITREGKGVVVNRRAFHNRLVREFEDYVKRLRKPTSDIDKELRVKFRQKMDYICKVKEPPKKEKTVVYFAYGSNMKLSRIKSSKRAPSAKPIGRAKLLGKRLTFNKISKDGSGKANIVDDKKAETWGVLFEIERKDWNSLDRCEAGYQRIQVKVMTDDGKTLVAETYVALGLDDNLQPSDSYKKMILDGANDFELPQSYIDGLSNVPSIPDPKSGSK